MNFLSGTLYKTKNNYYLYCKSVLLNDCVEWGGGLYNGDLPTYTEVTEDVIGFDEDTFLRVPELGTNKNVPRKITTSITPLGIADLVELMIQEIKLSKVEIKDAVILFGKSRVIQMEGRTYSVSIHDCTFLPMIENEIPEYNEYYVKVNAGDKVLKKPTDRRGYPASCGVENANKEIVVIVRGDCNGKC